jgi:Ni,Fe-hydrogenase maturation factor
MQDSKPPAEAGTNAIFVDACRMGADAGIRVQPLHACGSETTGSAVPGSGHGCDPCSLLALTQSVYGRCPQAWWLEVPAQNFTAGEALSETAQWGVSQELQEIAALIESLQPKQA